MKKVRLSYLRWLALAVLFSFVLFASISSEIGEWYALFLYPSISKILSAIASVVPFSLDEWAVLTFVFLLIGYPFYARIRKQKRWRSVVGGEVEILLWVYVWFYWGWGMNYYRKNFYQRAELKPAVYDEGRFHAFLDTFTVELNQAYEECMKEEWAHSPLLFKPMLDVSENILSDSSNLSASISSFLLSDVHREIKRIYRIVPAKYGLTFPALFQYPKYSSFNSLYSNVGVLGFMGPFFAESHVNHELTVLEYPFTYAHELSHLLGISSEAEANLWAYTVCIESVNPLIRFSGYLGLLSYVRSNAYRLLSPTEFDSWESSLSPDILATFYRVHAYWALRYNPFLGEIQSSIYSFYLKRNKISSGQKNYAQVVGMLLALPDFKVSLSED